MKNNQPILIIGLHRSGTTWLAKMLSLPDEIRYVSEPFNPNTGLKVFTDWLVYINHDNEGKYYQEIAKLMQVKGDFRFTLPNAKFLLSRFIPGPRRVMIKGIGGSIFSANWLADKFDMQVVAIMRHPAAFYASLKRLNWRFDFNNLLKQGALMRDYLEPYRNLMKKPDKSYSEEAGLLWLVVNQVLDRLLTDHPAWYFRRHEDLSLDPVGEYGKMYDYLGLEFTPKIEQQVRNFSNSGNRAEAQTNKAVELKRNSRAIITDWKKRLSQEEISVIKNITGELALKYYPENEW